MYIQQQNEKSRMLVPRKNFQFCWNAKLRQTEHTLALLTNILTLEVDTYFIGTYRY